VQVFCVEVVLSWCEGEAEKRSNHVVAVVCGRPLDVRDFTRAFAGSCRHYWARRKCVGAERHLPGGRDFFLRSWQDVVCMCGALSIGMCEFSEYYKDVEDDFCRQKSRSGARFLESAWFVR
jgi:hypothetical protein